ncbi:MAG TPA: hypothetical protein VMS17_31195 [Gemmataceae bacterium]|nr:hypothetical protein [Gemmataceae bacterium]
MSKFMLSMGLVLASLLTFSSAGQVEAESPDQTVKSADDVPYDDIGPYESLQDAVAQVKAWRANGSYATVVTAEDGSYYVRVFAQYDDLGPLEYGRAFVERDAWRANGSDADVVTKNGGYYVRVYRDDDDDDGG